jgi:hypothetical protein
MATRDTNKPRTDADTKPRKDNPDPITGAPGSHPVGTGIGAAGGGAAGAAIGAVAGPPGALAGAVIGATVGAVAGGYAGKGVAEAINPTAEDAYWRENYRNRPYVREGEEYDTYRPAYQHGWEARSKHEGRQFDEVEADLQRDWEQRQSTMAWTQAREPVRDAYSRHDQNRGTTGGTTGGATGATGTSQPGSEAPEVGRGKAPGTENPPDRRTCRSAQDQSP